jgi:F0F1-type ATP synthase assembly protein I
VLTAISLQAAFTLMAGMIAWLIWGSTQAVSLVAGGSSIVVPNALLALRLWSSAPSHAPVVLMVGEFVKVGVSVLMLWLSYRVIENLSWGALIAGVVVALKALLLTPWAQSIVDRAQARRIERQDRVQEEKRESGTGIIGTQTKKNN